ncbi:hypothetical protein D3C77_609210 [compost metagenome]
MIAHLLGKASEEQFFTGAVTAFDELHHATLHAMAHGPGQHAESRAALAFAVTAEYQQQAAFARSVGNALVDYRLLALHTSQVALVTLGGFSHRRLRKPLSADPATSLTTQGCTGFEIRIWLQING